MVLWDKTMKGISMKGNHDSFSVQNLSKYRNPIMNYCTTLQYGDKDCHDNLIELRSAMRLLTCNRGGNDEEMMISDEMNISITFNQNIFK